MSTSLDRYRLGVFRALQARIRLMNAGIGHTTTQGEANEGEVRGLLESILPSNWGVGSGVIVGVDGVESRQVDVVVYDRSRANYSLSSATHVFLADQVVAAIEVKTTFTSGSGSSLSSALENIASVKRLAVAPHPWIEPDYDPATGEYQLKRHTPGPPLGIALFLSAPETAGPLDLKQHFDILTEQVAVHSYAEQPDLLCSLDHASFFRHLDIGSHSLQTQELFATLVQLSDNREAILALDASFAQTKGIADFAQNTFEAGAGPQTVPITNTLETSAIRALTGPALVLEPNVYRVARLDRRFYVLDHFRAFLAFTSVLEKLLTVKKMSKAWGPADYFGASLFTGSVYPTDFDRYESETPTLSAD